MRLRLLRTALGPLAAALSLAACASDGAMGPRPLTAAAPAPTQRGLAGVPWETKAGSVLVGGVEYPVTVRYRSWAQYPGYAGTPVSIEYDVTSTLGAGLQCGETGFFSASITPVACAGTVVRDVPDFVSYTLPDLGDQLYEVYGTAGGYNPTGGRVLTGYPYLPYRVVDVAERVAPAKPKGRGADKKAAQAARKAHAAACGTEPRTGCIGFAVFSPGNLTRNHTPYAVTVDWGDGSAPEATGGLTTFSTPTAPQSTTARHVYAAPGSYTVRVRAANGPGTGSNGRASHEAQTTVVVE
jgi:hypothetical protein